MKAARVSLSAIKERDRWTIDWFLRDPDDHCAELAFQVIGDLVVERKESVEPFKLKNKTVNYLGLQNVATATGDLVDFSPVPPNEIRSRSRVFKPGDVLYGRLRPYLNKVFLVDETFGNGICSNEFIVLVPEPERIYPQYLRAALASGYVLREVSGLQTGSALPRLQTADLLRMRIPVPPLDEQRRITALIESRDAERRALRTRLAELEASTLESMLDPRNHSVGAK